MVQIITLKLWCVMAMTDDQNDPPRTSADNKCSNDIPCGYGEDAKTMAVVMAVTMMCDGPGQKNVKQIDDLHATLGCCDSGDRCGTTIRQSNVALGEWAFHFIVVLSFETQHPYPNRGIPSLCCITG